MRGLVSLENKAEEDTAAPQFQSDLPTPALGRGQVLLKVLACGLNHADTMSQFGGLKASEQRITGMDITGEVLELGAGVNNWAEGDQVLVDPILSCSECPDCRDGLESDCPQYGLLGVSRHGGHAEYVVVPAQNLHRIPRGMDAIQAAAVPLCFGSAWRMLQSRGRLNNNETVLVVGASGGVGIAAVQIARLAGCRVLALTSSEWKAQELRALGAHRAIVGHPDDGPAVWRRAVMKITGRRGVDAIVDPVGTALWPDFFEILAPRGRILSCGTLTGAAASLPLDLIQSKELSIYGSAPGGRKELSRVLALMSLSRFKVVVDRQLPFDRAAEAIELMRGRGLFGKIVMTP